MSVQYTLQSVTTDNQCPRSYLELMSELPWSKASTDSLDLRQARADLDHDHFGLDKLKKRVLEYLAVRQLKKSLKGNTAAGLLASDSSKGH